MKCALCLQQRELRVSHFLPASVWRRSREAFRASDPNPVVVAAGKAFTTSRQVTACLLCDDCEQRFSKNGENHVLSQCARPDGGFPLREALEATTPVMQDAELRVYDTTAALGGTIGHYLYFAASVFWRAAIHSWVFGGDRIEKLQLGFEYTEQFRQYLCGQASFPSNARLFVHISSDSRLDMTSIFPCSFRLDSAWRYKFYIPGILFILFLGGEVALKYDHLSLNGKTGSYIWLCPWQNDSLFRGFVKRVRQAVKLGGLNKKQ